VTTIDKNGEMMDLRPHQEKAIQMLRDSLRRGKLRPILAAPCSFGKTITAAYMLQEAQKKGKRGIFICDRIKLVEQALEEFDQHGMSFGIIQGNHDMTDHTKPIQIASIQTLAKRHRIPDFDFAIVDECHSVHKHVVKMMQAYTAVPFIGLSATPLSKGLGKYYDDLIVPITPTELLAGGFLAPIEYYGGRKVNTKDVRRRALSTGGTDFDPASLEAAINRDRTLAGDIVKNWMKFGQDRQTIAFSPSIMHSQYMVELFNRNGIRAEHIDGYMDNELRQALFDAHDAGEFKILSCSKLLNVGYDAPQVSCLIDCYPTTSKIAYIQRAGRIARTCEGKENAIYLDHSGNVALHGFSELLVPESLDDGEHTFSESKQLKKEKESKVWECPDCYQQRTGLRCPCGFEFKYDKKLVTDTQTLKKLTAQDIADGTYSKEQKGEFLGELYCYASMKGYKAAWADIIYEKKFGSRPNGIIPKLTDEISQDVKNYILYDQIRKAKGGYMKSYRRLGK
jgi:DNA repair protein RadD